MDELWQVLRARLRNRPDSLPLLYCIEHIIIFLICGYVSTPFSFVLFAYIAVRRHSVFLSLQSHLPSRAALLANLTTTIKTFDANEVCFFCRDEFKDPIELSCGHCMCRECFEAASDRIGWCLLCQTQLYARGTLYHAIKSVVWTSHFFLTVAKITIQVNLALTFVLALQWAYAGAPLEGAFYPAVFMTTVFLWKLRHWTGPREFLDAVDNGADQSTDDDLWQELFLIAIAFWMGAAGLHYVLQVFNSAIIAIWTNWREGSSAYWMCGRAAWLGDHSACYATREEIRMMRTVR
ncbi:hypothetical protein HII31_10858 [Pseudocercospora fuligena]|uniref:RING-type domain-containing protein n=1 Tax=Pseudocercospora fuligena TaxID=685502 RepID=A0A8H6RBF9_9PEZI|nr:hypothetical protein HII31_10858 [Pseudocercospora fuligena]